MGSNVIGCSEPLEAKNSRDSQDSGITTQPHRLSEVAPPMIIEELDSLLSKYQPQVSIVSPTADELFTENQVEVKLALKDLPIFQDSELNLGPYLQLILDNDRYLSIYDLSEPIVLDNLKPGTHTIRVFAAKPWHESFKNEGAYSQTQFHVYTQTNNTPDSSLPLLTYNSPQGIYGAEPIILDFYLTNAPLQLVAKQNPDDEIGDWRIRVTINDESFLLDTWKPVYLTGFQPGTNWVKLEFLNNQGERIDNLFNTTVGLVDYQPQGQDTLSQLIRGELDLEIAQSIVDPDYIIPSTSATETLPDTSETVETLPEVMETPETLPDTSETVETLPEVMETPETLPDTSETVETLPEVIETPENLPDTSETVETLPEVIETPENLPDTSETVEILPDTSQNPEILPETPETEIIKTEEEAKKPEWLQKIIKQVKSLDK